MARRVDFRQQREFVFERELEHLLGLAQEASVRISTHDPGIVGPCSGPYQDRAREIIVDEIVIQTEGRHDQLEPIVFAVSPFGSSIQS